MTGRRKFLKTAVAAGAAAMAATDLCESRTVRARREALD